MITGQIDLKGSYHFLLSGRAAKIGERRARVFPPTSRDPQGIHGLIWGDTAAAPPAEAPLTLVAYQASRPRCAYVEPTAVGNTLIDMPLFLDDRSYVPVPLEAMYQAAWRGVPQRWQSVLT